MKLIVDIPEEIYKDLSHNDLFAENWIGQALKSIKNGIPLDEDADKE